MVAQKKTKIGSLARGRPPVAKASRTMSRKASRTLINKHHQLEKQRRHADISGDSSKAEALGKEIEKLGGLHQYQQASLQGQSNDRGGDSSRVLLDWLPTADIGKLDEKLRLLEVGALSTRNACSTSGLFEVTHIDLNSQEPGIEQQDFMERPLPTSDMEKFDIISLSLVLNFVPEHAGRGQMLLRTLSFLKTNINALEAGLNTVFPSLFLVLPRSCVDNSRYFTETRLTEMMSSLGYSQLQRKVTTKLVYYLWLWDGRTRKATRNFTKQELNPGKTRNNFVVTLDKRMKP